MIPVRDIKLNNKEFLSILDEYKDALIYPEDEKNHIKNLLSVRHKDDKPDDWLSDEYMHEIINQGRGHEGFPLVLKGYSGLKYQDRPDSRSGAFNEFAEAEHVHKATYEVNKKLIEFLSCNNNALNACYPPGGFISWHNNANAEGYNIIITWSETGDGWFDYWDNEKKERVRIQDVPGWQAKMTYFGSYEKPENLVYHAAYTNCYRITVAFVFREADEFWEEVIEDLENPL